MRKEQMTCPSCRSMNVVKYGRQPNGAQRYRCHNPDCERQIFLEHYQGRSKKEITSVKHQIIEMALSGAGIRDTARALGVSPATVIEVFDLIANFGHGFPRGHAGTEPRAYRQAS